MTYINRLSKNFGRFLQTTMLAIAVMAGLLPTVASAINPTLYKQLQTPFYDPASSSCGDVSVSGDPIARFIQVIARSESASETGDPQAQNPNSTASGRYQYLDPTWKSQDAYQPARQYARAKDAPVEMQDAVAYIEYSSLYYQYKTKFSTSDTNKLVFYMLLNHYGGPGIVDSPSKWDVRPPGNEITYRDYADLTVERFSDSTYATKVVLSFTSAPDFASQYATKIGHPYAASGPTTGNASCSATPAGNFVFYKQSDDPWGSHVIYTPTGDGRDTMAYRGCGPTSVAMVVATLADSSVKPDTVGDFMTNLGSGIGYVPSGATVNGMITAAKNWGLNAQSIGVTDYDAAVAILRGGGLVIAGGAGLSPFSENGHVVVLRGLDSSGKFLIGNSAPNRQSGQDQSFSSRDLQAAGLHYMIGVTK